jgi:hypothetical protein
MDVVRVAYDLTIGGASVEVADLDHIDAYVPQRFEPR